MSEGTNPIFEFIVDDDEGGCRFDTLMGTVFPDISRTLAGRLIRDSLIRVNGKIRKPGFRVTPGETISGSIPPRNRPLTIPEAIDIDILYEDADCVVLNKPPGMVVHPAPGHTGGTLANALVYRYPDILGVGGIESRSGIVHRLDKDTSGVMLAARTAQAHSVLSLQFKNRLVRKTYLGFVYGIPAKEGAVKLPIGRHPGHRKKMTARDPANPRDAETRWHVMSQFNDVALVAFSIATGRTHQIRVHCAAMRHPIIGDTLYGPGHPDRSFNLTKKTAALAASVSRHLLHARSISFAHPSTGELLTFEAPIPADLLAFQKGLDPD